MAQVDFAALLDELQEVAEAVDGSPETLLRGLIDALRAEAAKRRAAVESGDGESEVLAVEDTGERFLLDVLAIPWGAPTKRGRNCHDRFFSPNTALYLDWYPRIPVLECHSDDLKQKAGSKTPTPEIIGEASVLRTDTRGVWYRASLYGHLPASQRLWAKANTGKLLVKASTGSFTPFIRADFWGECTHWAAVELSLIDLDTGARPCNDRAVVLPAAQGEPQ
jgi:hypothetical protein